MDMRVAVPGVSMMVNISPVPSHLSCDWQVALVMEVSLWSRPLTLKHPLSCSYPAQFLSLPRRTLAKLDLPTPVAPRMMIRGLKQKTQIGFKNFIGCLV